MRIQGQPGSGRAKSGMRPPDFCFPTLSSDKCRHLLITVLPSSFHSEITGGVPATCAPGSVLRLQAHRLPASSQAEHNAPTPC